MGSVSIFSGNYSKFLKSNIDFAGLTQILAGSVDPTVVATSAPKGSLYLNNLTGFTYRKTDAGSSTNWINIYKAPPSAFAITSKTGNYTATTSDDVVQYDISGGNATLTLYAASGNSGKQLTVRLTTTATTNVLTITDGGSFTKKAVTAGEVYSLYSNGTSWKIQNHYIPRTMATTTTTWTAAGSNPTKGGIVTDRITYWREGRFMVGNIDYGQNSSGTAGSGVYQLLVPGSWSIVTTNISVPASPSTGNGLASVIGSGPIGNDTAGITTSFLGQTHVYDSTHFFLRKMANSNSARVSWANTDVSVAFNSTQTYVSHRFRVPITNWDS